MKHVFVRVDAGGCLIHECTTHRYINCLNHGVAVDPNGILNIGNLLIPVMISEFISSCYDIFLLRFKTF